MSYIDEMLADQDLNDSLSWGEDEIKIDRCGNCKRKSQNPVRVYGKCQNGTKEFLRFECDYCHEPLEHWGNTE